jgi:integrase
LRHNNRGKVLAKIYKRPDCYRLSWRVTGTDGKRVGRQKEFRTYAEAARFGRKLVKDLAKGRAVELTPGQVSGAVAAFKLLQDFRPDIGRQVPLLECVAGYCGALRRLKDISPPLSVTDALDAYMSTVAPVKRKAIAEAVDDWLAGRKPKTVARQGKRAQLSSGYHYNTALVLREFAGFTQRPGEFAESPKELAALTKGWKEIPVRAIADLSKEHLDGYIALHAALAPKSRNERRMVLKMFLGWCVAKDYLSKTHRLLEADGMAREDADAAEIKPYTAEELAAMLERASRPPAPVNEGEKPQADYRPLLPIIALVALGGIRLGEAARMTFEDVWRVSGHVEVSVAKSKTRSRRLSTMCPALAAWLEDYRDSTGPLWKYGLQHFHKAFERMLAELEIPVRRNALRHGFVSAHYALHADEGFTAKEAGNSPAIVHANYRSLMTKAQGEAWFNVTPTRPGNVVMLSGAARQK